MSTHPTKEQLSNFLRGALPPEAADTVADHLERCPPCQETIAGLESGSDALLDGLRRPPPEEIDPVGRRAVERIGAATPIAVGTGLSAVERGEPLSRGEFVSRLLSSGVIDAESLARIERDDIALAQAVDGESLARRLVESGVLTPFQAEAILRAEATRLRFGEYVIVDRLGAGGMGEVFRARHRSMDRVVALKVPAKEMLRSADAVKRFEREVRAAARLLHPNIVTAYDASTQDGVHYLVMEYVAGCDLSTLIKRRGPLPVALAVDYVLQAARGLAFAHAKGIVHRDIKPANLLVDEAGVVKILDMGLARLDQLPDGPQARGEGLTEFGQVMGTADYMAPEQAENTSRADGKADVYSLGCTLYRLLTGENPYGGDTPMAKFLEHRERPIPSLRTRRSEVSAELEALFQQMVAKRAEDRPTSAELVAGLEPIERGPPTTDYIPTGPDEPSLAGRVVGGNRLASLRRIVLAALLGAAIWIGWQSIARRNEHRPEPVAGGSGAAIGAARRPLAPSRPDEIARLQAAGATLTLRTTADSEIVVRPDQTPPAEPATIVGVDLGRDGSRCTDELLGGLAGLVDLETLVADFASPGSLATADGVRKLGALVNLRRLSLGRIGTAEVNPAFLAALSELHTLELSNLTFADWEPHVAGLKSLEELRIYNLDGARLELLGAPKRLTYLRFHGNGSGAAARDETGSRFARLVPWCRIEIDSRIIEPTAPPPGAADGP